MWELQNGAAMGDLYGRADDRRTAGKAPGADLAAVAAGPEHQQQRAREGAHLAEDLKRQAEEFFAEFMAALAKTREVSSPEWNKVRAALEQLSRERVRAGFSYTKRPRPYIFPESRAECVRDR